MRKHRDGFRAPRRTSKPFLKEQHADERADDANRHQPDADHTHVNLVIRDRYVPTLPYTFRHDLSLLIMPARIEES